MSIIEWGNQAKVVPVGKLDKGNPKIVYMVTLEFRTRQEAEDFVEKAEAE